MFRITKKRCVEYCDRFTVWKFFKPVKKSDEFERARLENHVKKGYVQVSVRSSNSGKEEKELVDIPLCTTPCFFGGYRVWFRCPYCSKRVGVLYTHNAYPLSLYCRWCLDLTYKDRQRKGSFMFEPGRLARKQRVLREKMDKKGIHLKTFARLYQEYVLLDKVLAPVLKAKNKQLENRVLK